MKNEFSCKRCGSCCLKGADDLLDISDDDIKRWEEEGRTEIISYVFVKGERKFIANGWYYGMGEARCPFLDIEDGNVCTIHDTKPWKCRMYPRDNYGNIRPGMDVLRICPGVREVYDKRKQNS